MKMIHSHTTTACTLIALLAMLSASPLFAQSTKTNTTAEVSTNTKTNSQKTAVIKTVTIGTQVSMAENLNVSTFRNGDPIPEIKSNEAWGNAYKENKAAWSYYDNDPANGSKYGKLYNWYAVNDPRGIAPKGWHVPTDKEWQTLTTTLGGQSVAFAKMKSSSGFSALPAANDITRITRFIKSARSAFGGLRQKRTPTTLGTTRCISAIHKLAEITVV